MAKRYCLVDLLADARAGWAHGNGSMTRSAQIRHVRDRHPAARRPGACTLNQSRQLMQRFFLLTAGLIAAGLAGCAGGTDFGPTPQKLTWVRTDGQSGKANPALADQFTKDRSECVGSTSPDNAALLAARDCMSKRGYVLVSADQAEATAAKFRAETAAKYTAKPTAH
jgi:hypothetical protein